MERFGSNRRRGTRRAEALDAICRGATHPTVEKQAFLDSSILLCWTRRRRHALVLLEAILEQNAQDIH